MDLGKENIIEKIVEEYCKNKNIKLYNKDAQLNNLKTYKMKREN